MNTSRKKLIKIRAVSMLCILTLSCAAFSACGNTAEESTPSATKTQTTAGVSLSQTPAQTAPVQQTATPAPTADLSAYAVNPITGVQDMDKSNAGKRPIALMISNIKQANPQAGITACDMFYEIPAEGGITRIMGMFADVSRVPVVGSIRSAREYYVQLAMGYNAIFGHYGTSTSAESLIKNSSVNNLEGMTLSDTFWRDQNRINTMGSVHSVVTSGEKLLAAINKKNYNMNTGLNGGTAFKFYPRSSFTADGTANCNKVTAKFSGSYVSDFTYDSAAKLYSKYQFNAAHVDDKGNQIKVTNVIVIYTKMSVLDSEKHISVDLSGGKGYYISGGKSKEITWSKGSNNNPIKYMNTDGSDLTVNAGKTYVCIVDGADKIILSAT